jgi:TonB family protein
MSGIAFLFQATERVLTAQKLRLACLLEGTLRARRARYQGTVVLQAIVRRDGTIDILRVVRSLGLGLDERAVDALKQWRFQPGTKNGQAVDVFAERRSEFLT